ncbi:MAG: DUF6089 family protein [Bacteroidota bacterium]
MRITFCLIAFCVVHQTFSQNFLSSKFEDRYFSVTLGTGVSSYFGELNSGNSINDRLSQINAGIEARLLSRVGAKLEATYYTLKGNDLAAPDSSFQRQRNLSFNSRNFQVQLNIVYYLRKYTGAYYSRWNIDPYVYSGIGYTFFNPTADLGGETFSLREAKTEGVSYGKWAWSLPLGAGIKFRVNDFLNINFDLSYHFAFTDYLDDVSNTYATELPNGTAELLSDRKDEIGVINQAFYDQITPGSIRGDASDNDRYLFISLKLELFIPPSLFVR